METQYYFRYEDDIVDGSRIRCQQFAVGEVVTPSNVTHIKTGTFYNCSGITSLIFHSDVTAIGHAAIQCCHGIKTLTIPNHITDIEEGFIFACLQLRTINIPIDHPTLQYKDGCVLSKDGSILYAAIQMTECRVPNGVKRIGKSAFAYQDYLQTILFPDTLEEIGEEAFQNCASLKDITLPCSLLTIEDNAFDGCESIRNLILPDSITHIGAGAFNFCTGLGTIQLPKDITRIDSFTFSNCSKIKKIFIPESVKSIEEDAFSGCEELCKVIGITPNCSISDSAFEDTSIDYDLLPNARDNEHSHFSFIDTTHVRENWEQRDIDIQLRQAASHGLLQLMAMLDKLIKEGKIISLQHTKRPEIMKALEEIGIHQDQKGFGQRSFSQHLPKFRGTLC